MEKPSKIRTNYTKLVDYLFWILFILFTNPGSLLEALGEDSGDGGVNITDLLFFGMGVCYAFVIYKDDIGRNKAYSKMVVLILITTAYHFLMFNFFVPVFKETLSKPASFVLIKSRHEVFSVLLFFMTYRFFIRSNRVFLNLFIFSSILIMTLFLFTLTTGVDILPVGKVNRGFVNVDRMLLMEYGLMPILIPLGAVILSFKIENKYRKYLIIGFGLMFLTWLLSLTRRHVFGTVIYLILALMLNNYIHKKSLIPVGRALTVSFYGLVIAFFIFISFPKYMNAFAAVISETVYVMRYGETTTGRTDARLGLGKKFMQDLIADNYVWGTGFDNRWRGTGDKAGYETSDYPFLSAIAMKGVVGVLLFLPVYILLIKTIRSDILFFRKYKIEFNSVEFMFVALFLVFFIYDLMQYMNLFKPVSRLKDYEWYMYLAMFLASRQLYYQKHIFGKKKRING